MDLSKIKFEDFASSMKRLGMGEIRAIMAKPPHCVRLPAHSMAKDALIRAAWDGLQAGLASQPADAPPQPDEAPPQSPEAPPQRAVRATRGPDLHEQDGHWRCGRHWPASRWTTVAISDFTDDEWARIERDPRLTIKGV